MSPVYINGVEQVVAHKTRHQDTGADEISVAALSGELADRQPSKAGTSGLGWTDEKLLKGAGAGVAPDEIDVPAAYTPPTRSLWIPIMIDNTGHLAKPDTKHVGVLIAAAANYGLSTFRVPVDFASLVSIYAIYHDRTDAGTIDYTITTGFGAVGQDYDMHTDSVTADGLVIGNTKLIKGIDISAAFTGLAAGDYCYIKFYVDVVAAATLTLLGYLFSYSE